MAKKLFAHSSLQAYDLRSFQRQETIFILLNIIVLAVLVVLHAWFRSYWATPSTALIAAAGVGLVLKTVELIWLRGLRKLPSPNALVLLTWGSILLNLSLAILLSYLTNHEDSPYFALALVAILEAAFRFHFVTVMSVVAIADFLTFAWVWYFFRQNPPLELGEYFEAGITSMMFVVVGSLVWWLLADLQSKDATLADNLQELEHTREKLLQEEKLAAVGRLSSAIAHEIRNPVAMISSSLATAKSLTGAEREEMLEIASEEASRLVALTTDFLAYARPRPPKLEVEPITDVVDYVADACRGMATQKEVQLHVDVHDKVKVNIDPAQLQQALVNLVMNAVDASPKGSAVLLRVSNGNQRVAIDVENGGPAIPDSAVARIFEPFFTTKPQGSGLGLAIARNIVRAHGGDLELMSNGPDRICFRLSLPAAHALDPQKGIS